MNFKERKSNNRFDILKRNTEDVSFRSKYKIKQNQQASCTDIPEDFLDSIQNKNKFKPQPKKKFNLVINDVAFPSLGQEKKNEKKNEKNEKEPMNFSAVTKQKQQTKKDTVIEPKDAEPGWIKLWKTGNDGIIYSSYGLPTKWRNDEYLRDEKDFKIVSKQILVQWQNERDEINELLGDRSPYYDTPSLLEYLPEEDEDYYITINSDQE